MLNQVETMFDDMEKMIKKLKKKQYEENMENFMAAYEAYFLEMETYMSENDPQTAAKEISQVFVDAVKKRYEVKGKIKGYVQADLNLFMILCVKHGVIASKTVKLVIQIMIHCINHLEKKYSEFFKCGVKYEQIFFGD